MIFSFQRRRRGDRACARGDRRPRLLIGRAFVASALLVGCGGGTNEIVEPDNPTPLPDASQRLSTGDALEGASQGPARSLGR
jgi:hypothetical protein